LTGAHEFLDSFLILLFCIPFCCFHAGVIFCSAGLSELRLARIASFVPDLLVLKGLVGFETARSACELTPVQLARARTGLPLGLQTRT
jgi:hypothetical protein